jgi:hypothetical protein
MVSAAIAIALCLAFLAATWSVNVAGREEGEDSHRSPC